MPARSTRSDDLLTELVDLYLAEGFSSFGVGDLAARLRCSRSTLYGVARSKEQIIVRVVRAFFRGATLRVEERVAAADGAAAALSAYIEAIAVELSPATDAFYADLAAFEPAAEIYRDNTRAAAERVQLILADGVRHGEFRDVDAAFVGAAVAQIMEAIQGGAIEAATGLTDAQAYRSLLDLVLRGVVVR